MVRNPLKSFWPATGVSYHRVSNLFGREAKRPRRKKKPPHGSEPFAGRLRKQPRWWALSELLRRQT